MPLPRFYRLVALLVCMPLFAACGGTSAPQKMALRFAFPDMPETRTAAEALKSGYIGVAPGVTIELQPLPAEGYGPSLAELLKGTDGPDLFISVDSDLPLLEEGDALLDLTPHGITPGSQPPALLAPWHKGDKLLGLPQQATPHMLFYNKALFDAGEQPYPTDGWHWDEWRAAAKRVSKREQGVYGTAVGSWESIIWNNGGSLLNGAGTKALLDQPEAYEAIQFVADMINVDGSAPLPPIAGGPDPTALFREGKLAMLPAPSSLMASLQEQPPAFEWGVAPLATRTQRATVLAVTGLAASAKTPHPDAAARFVGWAGGAGGLAATTAAFPYAVPALAEVAPAPALRDAPNGSLVVAALGYGRVPTFVKETPEINTLVNDALVPVWRGESTAEAAYRAVTPKIDAILERG